MNKKFTLIFATLLCFTTALEAQFKVQLSCDGSSRHIIVQDFTDIVSMQFEIAYDPGVYQVDSIDFHEDFFQPNYGIYDTIITVSWWEPFLNGVTLPDGAALLTIHFEKVGNGDPNVCFGDSFVPNEFVEYVTDIYELPISTFCNSIEVDGASSHYNLMLLDDSCFNIQHNPLPYQYTLQGDFTNCNIYILNMYENIVELLPNTGDKITIDFCDLSDGYRFIRIEHQDHEDLFFQTILKEQ